MELNLAILVIGHFIADFILQTRTMAKQKSVDPQWLLRHGLTQAWVLYAVSLYFFTLREAAIFSVANAVIHCIIDWNIWKVYKAFLCRRLFGTWNPDALTEGRQVVYAKYEYWEDYWFYTCIGFDQLLHILTLIGLYKVLMS